MKRVFTLILFFPAISNSVIPLKKTNVEKSLPEGFSTLPEKLRHALLTPSKGIWNVTAEIEQFTSVGGSTETRNGYYRADSKGRFRIDYTNLDELVVFNGNRLYWHIKSNGFIWEIPDMSDSPSSRVQTIEEKPYFISEQFRIQLEKRPWSSNLPGFSDVEFFSVTSKKTGITIIMKYQYNIHGVVSRWVLNKDGREIMVEMLEEPILYAGAVFFRNSSVIAGDTQSGAKLVSKTIYKNLRFNTHLPESIFNKPKGKIREYRPG